MNSANARDRLIVALDLPFRRDALEMISRLDNTCLWFKVGMQLFYAEGPRIIADLRERGHEVFLDLKLHDIPNTAAAAVRSVVHTGASLLTVHASGGAAMLSAAQQAAQSPGASTRLLAVTVLTSMDTPQLRGIGISEPPATHVLRLAQLARSSGIDGLVCSAEEVTVLRQHLGADVLLVTPGIRPTGADLGDQKRVAGPAEALRLGASMLVVGRPILKAPDPAAAAAAILAEMQQQLDSSAHQPARVDPPTSTPPPASDR